MTWVYKWNDWVSGAPELPGVYRRRDGGYHVRARAADPRTGKLREVNNALPDCKRAREAASILETKLAAIRSGAASPSARSKMPSFATYAVELMERRINDGTIRAPMTKRQWAWALETFLVPAFGDVLIDRLGPTDVEAWKAKMAPKIKAKEYAPTSLNDVMKILRTICAAAVIEFDVKDPMRGVSNFDTRTHRTYTPEDPNSMPPDRVGEFLDLARTAVPDHYAMIYVMLFTGLRPSTLRPLRVRGETRDVDLDAGTLIIRRSYTLGKEALEMTKTGNDQVIHMPAAMVDVLRWHVARLAKENEHRRKRFPKLADAMAASELLFPASPNRWDNGGGFQGPNTLSKPFKALGAAMKLKYEITPRSMRRTYQDLARAAGLRDVVTRAVSGHATEEMQWLYSTVGADEMRAGLAQVIALATRRPQVASKPTPNKMRTKRAA